MLESRYGDTDELLAAMLRFLIDSGVPEDRLPDLNFASMAIKSMVTMAAPDVLFEDGKTIELPGWSLRTIWTPGHSPGHVCFFSEEQRLLLSGDHVLPRITPNISVHAQQPANPLGDYLDSLLKVDNLGTEEVLPAHEYRFADLHGRLEEIIVHHADRLDEYPERGRQAGVDGLGDHRGTAVVAALGADPVLHAAPSQWGDGGALHSARAARSVRALGPSPSGTTRFRPDRGQKSSRPGSSASAALLARTVRLAGG